MKKVKIIATLGPTSDSEKGITRLAQEGVDVFRLNMSHYATEDALRTLGTIRKVEKKLNRPFGVFGDLAGPKIRTGTIAPDSRVAVGDLVRIQKKLKIGSAKAISLNFPDVVDNLEMGAEIYLADGVVKLEVVKRETGAVTAHVLVGGALRSRMGFSAHGLALKKFVLTPKDRADLAALSAAGVDALAVSFVQTAKDVDSVRKLLPRNSPPFLIAKMETAASIRNAEAISDSADALMVARGDLGFAVPLARLPHIQKELIALCIRKGKPVITATQMLESMIQAAFPTRAEVSDVANAILDGTDAVMLSAETAAGKFPFETVRTMRMIIEGAIQDLKLPEPAAEKLTAAAASEGAVRMAARTGAKLILAFTESGANARRVARLRPAPPILALSPSERVVRALCFTWGTYPVLVPRQKDLNAVLAMAKKLAARNPILPLKKGDMFAVSAGVTAGRTGATNLALIEQI